MLENYKLKARVNSSSGLTIIEVLFTVLVLSLVVTGIFQLFLYCSKLSSMARDLTFAVSEAQGKWEEIRNHEFDDVVVDYGAAGIPGNTFNLNQLNGMGVIYIDDTNPEVLEIEVLACWQTAGGRIIGEDKNLDGILNAGEDENGNGKLDSPLSLVSLRAKR